MIQRVERQAETIRIWATDDVTVASVQVMVLDEQGKVVEMGEAIKGKGDWWEYVPTGEGKVVYNGLESGVSNQTSELYL